MKIVFVHTFLLHYHFPRLANLSQKCQEQNIEFQNIQLSSFNNAYHSLYKKFETEFENFILFPDQELSQISLEKMWKHLEAKLIQIKPDVIFTYGYSLPIMGKVQSWSKKNQVATVLISDSNMADKKRYKVFEWLKSIVVMKYDAAFVAGTSSSSYIQSLGMPIERIITGYDVVHNEVFYQINAKNKLNRKHLQEKWNLPDKYFLFVGRLVKNKNINGLIDAYETYTKMIGNNDTPWSIVICGNGPDDLELKAQVKKLHRVVAERIIFTGLVLQPELIELFSLASCFILPSVKNESWGLVVNEALACNLPVIVSNRCGCAEDLVLDGKNGWVFDPFEENSLSKYMLQIHQLDDESWDEMGKTSKEIISGWDLQRFSNGAIECSKIAMKHKRSLTS